MTHDDVARWLGRYLDAWTTYDPAAIGALFSETAAYRYHPWDEPLAGRDAIVADWLANRDEPGTFAADYAPWAVDGDRAVATGTSRYDDGTVKQVFHNVFLLEFDPEGRCSSFVEIFIEQK
jgi:hypothetical protein